MRLFTPETLRMIAVLTYPGKKRATHACMLCNLPLKRSCFFQLFLISTLVFDVMPSISRFFCARLTGCVCFLKPGLPTKFLVSQMPRLSHNAALLGGLKVLVSCTKICPQHSLLSRRTGCITPQHSFERVSNYALKVGGKKA